MCPHLTYGSHRDRKGLRDVPVYVHVCVCARVHQRCVFFLLMREDDLISADMFFLQRPFISHPAPPLNTSLIVYIDCFVPAMRIHKRLEYGLMFEHLAANIAAMGQFMPKYHHISLHCYCTLG